MTTAIATKATIQFAAQLSIADCDNVNPIAIIIGPVTIGGKNLITFVVPNTLMNAAKIKYKKQNIKGKKC